MGLLLPLLGLGAKLIGGNRANKSNLAATNATNATNEKINKRTLAYDKRKFDLTRHDNHRRIRNTVLDAKMAGINPLTALGLAGAPTTSHPGAPGQIGAVAPPPLSHNAGEYIGEAAMTLFNELDPVQKEREQLQNDLMKAELEELQRNTAVVRDRNFGYSIPHVTNLTGTDYGNASESIRRVDAGRSSSTVSGDGALVAGHRVTEDKGWSDAEEIEERYGDAVSWAYGTGVALADFTASYNESRGPSEPPKMATRKQLDEYLAPYRKAIWQAKANETKGPSRRNGPRRQSRPKHPAYSGKSHYYPFFRDSYAN